MEIPSIMLENWIWLPDVLIPLSHHWSHLPQYQELWKTDHPGQELPDEDLPKKLAEDLYKTRTVNGAQDILGQVRLSLFDMIIHGEKEVDIEKTWNDLKTEVMGLKTIGGKGFAGFAHVFKGYDAGYYGYAL